MSSFEERRNLFDQFLQDGGSPCQFAAPAAKNGQIMYAECPASIRGSTWQKEYDPDQLLATLTEFALDRKRHTLVLIPEIDPGNDRTQCLATARDIFVQINITAFVFTTIIALQKLLKSHCQSSDASVLNRIESTIVSFAEQFNHLVANACRIFDQHRESRLPPQLQPTCMRMIDNHTITPDTLFGFCVDPSYATQVNNYPHPRYSPIFATVLNWNSDFESRIASSPLFQSTQTLIKERYGGQYNQGFYLDDVLKRTQVKRPSY